MKNFRYDINGLRAWAVLAVIFYHFNLFKVTGGYAGVDVFFVISGFLMTKIITDRLCHVPSQFSLMEFYLFRAKRIIPPLLVLCVFLIILGYNILLYPQYYQLSKQTISAITFLSNGRFFIESGYFDAAVHTKWLLHTWSLSVEWQFYFIFPLLLLIAYKFSPKIKTIKLVVLISTILSMGYCIFITRYQPEFAFYMLPTRAWEMLAGGCVYLFLNNIEITKKSAKALEYLGFLLIIASFFILTKNDIWPGWLATIPVLGAALIISAKRQDSFLTNNRSVQYLGNISYSLYLWHWPAYVFLVHYKIEQNNWDIFLALVTTFIVAHLSYRWIETPSRSLFNKKPYYRSLVKITLPMAVFLLIPYYIKLHHGIVNPVMIELQKIINEETNKNPRAFACELQQKEHPESPLECTYGGKELGVILLGDSHASSVVLALKKALPNKKLHVLDWSILACPAMVHYEGDNETYKKCTISNQYFLEKNKSLPKNIPLLMVNFVNAQENMEMACEIAKTRPVYLLRPTPQFSRTVPTEMAQNIWKKKKETRLKISITDYKTTEAKFLKFQDEAAKHCGIKILETLPYLCQGDSCYGDYQGLPIYYDEHHLNLRGADLLIPVLKQIFAPT